MESDGNIALYRYSRWAQDCHPLLEDLFSFILKMIAGNVLILCETNDDITDSQIRISSNEHNAALVYYMSVFHNYTEAFKNCLSGLMSVTSLLNRKTDYTEFLMLANQYHEENGRAFLMNEILNEIFSIILDVITGGTLFTSRTQFTSREYNILARANRPSLFLVHSDCTPDEEINEQMKHNEALYMNKKVISTVHNERLYTPKGPYPCRYCGKTFSMTSHVKRHERLHTGERPYICIHCGKAFSDASHVKNHERSHTGVKPYKCIHCEKTFFYISQVKRHERLHTGERPFKCKHCGKTFSDAAHLKSHERLHTGERPYKCMYCEKAFIQASHAKSHQRLHTGERPYQCKHCGKTFSDASHLRRHEKLHIG